jgi:uncharacterized protein with GYD domain
MPKFVAIFSVSGDALARFIDNPEDRRAPVAKLAEAAGGKLVSYYWMFGQYDGLAIADYPDAASAAAVAFVATSSGAFTHFETHELLETDELVRVLQKAKTMRTAYRPIGQTTG